MSADASPAGLDDELRDMQSLTDAALSRLDGRELLVELLARTREILQADTAAVLLLDYSSGQLIATAAAVAPGSRRRAWRHLAAGLEA